MARYQSSLSLIPMRPRSRFIGINVVRSYAEDAEAFDAVVVTHLAKAKIAFDQAIDVFGAERVLAPDLLRLRRSQEEGAT